MKDFNYEDFNSKSWSKRSAIELKRYISHSIKEINKRDINDKVAREAYNILGETVTGYTKKGKLSARVIGKTKEELLYEARSLHNFLDWDYTSDIGKKQLQGKYKESYLSYISKNNHMEISEEVYERYVELVNAFEDLSESYGSEQIREWVDTIEESGGILTYKDLQDALLEYADKNIPEDKIRHKGLGKQARRDAITEILDNLLSERI